MVAGQRRLTLRARGYLHSLTAEEAVLDAIDFGEGALPEKSFDFVSVADHLALFEEGHGLDLVGGAGGAGSARGIGVRHSVMSRKEHLTRQLYFASAAHDGTMGNDV
jgi:hypothetical protein